MLAGIPSIIYGIWGLFVFAPWFQTHVQQPIITATGDNPRDRHSCSAAPPYGIGIFTAGLILSIMILPFISAVTRDVFETVPSMLKEASYGLGSTSWEVMWRVCLPFCPTGVVGGAMLALGRALGETMAVTFVIGNAHKMAPLFSPGTPISATIANEFTEATTTLYTASLIELGLILVLHHLHRAGHARSGCCCALERGKGQVDDRQSARSISAAASPMRSSSCLSLAAALFGLVWLAFILGALLTEGVVRAVADAFHPVHAAARHGGRAFQRHLRQRGHEHAARWRWARPSGCLPAPIWPNMAATPSFAFVVRFVNDILLSAPSIVTGLFIYEIVVVPMGHFSGMGRRAVADGDRDPGGGAHHREHAAAGAQRACAKPPAALGAPHELM